jgi:hypothetical protein
VNKLLTVTAIASAFAFQSLSASATSYDPNYDFGDMGPTASGVTKSITASADNTWGDYDTFAFTISATTGVTGSAPDVDLAYWFDDVDVKSVALFKNVIGTDPQIGNTDTSTEQFSFSNLGAGSYYLKVLVNGCADYKVTLSTSPTASAVPEPEAYAMMLAGLGLIGFAARRKQQ